MIVKVFVSVLLSLSVFIAPAYGFDCDKDLKQIKINEGTGFNISGPGFIVVPFAPSDLKSSLLADLKKVKDSVSQWGQKFPLFAKRLSRNWIRFQHVDPQNWVTDLEGLSEIGFSPSVLTKIREHIQLVTSLLQRELPDSEPKIFFNGLDFRWANKGTRTVGDKRFHTDRTYITVLSYLDGPGVLIKKKDGRILSTTTGDVVAITGEMRSNAYWRKGKKVKATLHATPEWDGDRLLLVLYFSI